MEWIGGCFSGLPLPERRNLLISLCFCWSNICPENDDCLLAAPFHHPTRLGTSIYSLITALIGLLPLTNTFFLRSNSFFVVPVFHFPWSDKGYESRKAKPAALSA